jgi:hypothetical protein
MIGNQDNYLFLKQMLVVLQACRNGVELDLKGELVNGPIAAKAALERIQLIEDEFTVPRFQDFVQKTTIDYEHLNEMINLMGSTIEPDSELAELVKETALTENLYKTVCDLPTCQFLIEQHRTHLQDETRFPINAEIITDIARTVDNALNWTREWINAESSPYPLAQVVLVINCVQLVDEMIQFGNDRFIGC